MELTTIETYLNAIDSKSSTPGGGSVAALVGELGVCLGRMYGHLSVNTKAFLAMDEQSKAIFTHEMNQLEKKRTEIHQYIIKDMEVYDDFCIAYKDQSRERDSKIQLASKKAMNIPLQCMRAAYQIMQSCERMLLLGNKRAISDCAIAISLCYATIESSYLNVLINLMSLDDKTLKESTMIETEEIMIQSEVIKTKCMKATIEVIKR